jgi:hypothetical protein
MKAAKSDEWVTALINRPAIGVEPATTWPALLQNSFLKVKPQGKKILGKFFLTAWRTQSSVHCNVRFLL